MKKLLNILGIILLVILSFSYYNYHMKLNKLNDLTYRIKERKNIVTKLIDSTPCENLYKDSLRNMVNHYNIDLNIHPKYINEVKSTLFYKILKPNIKKISNKPINYSQSEKEFEKNCLK